MLRLLYRRSILNYFR